MAELLAPVFVVVFAILMIVFVALGWRKGARPTAVRDIEAFLSLPTTVGQAVETGKRLHISLGSGAVGEVNTAAAFAGLTVLEQISAAAAVSDKPPIVTTADGTAMLLAQDTLRQVYQQQNALNRYDTASARVAGLSPMSFGAALTTTLSDESVAGTVLIGSATEEVVLLTEAAQRAHTTTLAASDNPATQALLYVTADSALVGEDLFAGGAYISRLPMHVASLHAQDVMRLLVGAAIILGVVASTVTR